MGKMIHICSGIGMDAVSVLHPSGVLVNAAKVLETANSHRQVLKFIHQSQAKRVSLDNGMYSFFRLWQDGKMVSYDSKKPVYPRKSAVAINLTPQHTIAAALKLSPHVDTMIANDLPVRKSTDQGEQEFLFRNVMYFNKKAAEEIVALRERYCPTVSLLYAIQAYNLDQLMVVMQEIRDLQFDGFSLPIRPYRWNQLLAMLVMLSHLKVKRVHILGSSNVSTLAIAAFASRHLFDEVSWDASSFHKYSIYLFYQLKDLTAVWVSLRTLLSREWSDYRCDCPACGGKPLIEIRNISDLKVKRKHLVQHNFYVVEEAKDKFYSLAEDPKKLRDYLLKISNRYTLIKDMNEAMSSILNFKEFLNDYDFAKGFCEYIFSGFKSK